MLLAATSLAYTITAAVFFGVLATSGLLFVMRTSLHEARKLELARRLGPADMAPQLVLSRQMDTTGKMLGALGVRLYELRVRAGRSGSVAAVVVPSLVLAIGAPALLIWLLQSWMGLVAVVAGMLPVILLQREAEQRSAAASYQLPDALDLIARAMRAGHAFSDSLRIAATDIPSPLGEEIGHAAEEHRLGVELRDALQGLVHRMPTSFELRLLVSAVLLNRETGGNLIEILEHLAETVRERIVFESKVKALTAEVRTSATILSFLPFGAAGLLTIVEPGYLLPLFDPGIGRFILVGALILMAAGIALMSRLSHVEM